MSEDALERLRDMFRPTVVEEPDLPDIDEDHEEATPSATETPRQKKKGKVKLSRLKQARGIPATPSSGVPAHYREWPPPNTDKLIQITSSTHPIRILLKEEETSAVNQLLRNKFRVIWSTVSMSDGSTMQYPRSVFVLFGKHKGEKLKDLPGGYLRWLLDEDFPAFIKGFVNAVLFWNND